MNNLKTYISGKCKEMNGNYYEIYIKKYIHEYIMSKSRIKHT